MSFFHVWAREIAGGNLLSVPAPRPAHEWHERVAREAHALAGSAESWDDRHTMSIWNGWLGERTFYQDPLYPYLLASLYALFGEQVESVFLVQAGLGVAIAGILCALAAHLFGPATGLAAGLMAALYAPLIFFEGALLRPTLVSFLTLATAAAATRAAETPERGGWWCVTGALGALGVLAASTNLLVVVGLALYLLVRGRRAGSRVTRSALLFLGAFLGVLSPLFARNLAVGLPPWALAATGPINFVMHNAPDYRPEAGFFTSTFTAPIMQRTGGAFLPAVRETVAAHAHLGAWLLLVAKKALVFWHWPEVPNNTNFYYGLLQAPLLATFGVRFTVVAPLAFAGWTLARRSRAPTGPLLIVIGATLLTCVVFLNLARLRLPAALAMIPLAAHAVIDGGLLLVTGRVRAAAPALVAAALGAVLVLAPGTGGSVAIRVADYGVGNLIATHRAEVRRAAGDPAGALRLVEKQLETEPDELRGLAPAAAPTALPPLAAQMAGSFADIHRLGAELCRQLGRMERSAAHARQAALLVQVHRQYEAAASGRRADD